MNSELTREEIKVLSNYRFVVEEPEKEVQIDFTHFLNEASTIIYLKKFKSELKAPDLKTAASVFMKRHAFLAAIYLYTMSAFNKKMNVSPENIILADAIKDGFWLPEFYLKNQSTDVCTDDHRNEWRLEAVRHLFKENLFPVIESLSKAAKISKQILWENVAVYIFWLYEKMLSQAEDEELRSRASDDFSYLIQSAPGELFGDDSNNLIAQYYSAPIYQEETDSYTRIRKTCCFSYKLKEKGTYCNTCPRTCGKGV